MSPPEIQSGPSPSWKRRSIRSLSPLRSRGSRASARLKPEVARAAPEAAIPHRGPMHFPGFPFMTVQKNLTSKPQGWELYCDEIEVQKTHSNHRKLDSQTALSHRARG